MSQTGTKKTTREQWSHGMALAGVVNAVNAPFCDPDEDDEEPAISDLKGHINAVATIVADQCGVMAIQDSYDILSRALEIHDERNGS